MVAQIDTSLITTNLVEAIRAQPEAALIPSTVSVSPVGDGRWRVTAVVHLVLTSEDAVRLMGGEV